MIASEQLTLALAKDGAQPPIERLLRLMVRVTGANGALLLALDKNEASIVAAHHALPFADKSMVMDDRSERRLIRDGGSIESDADRRAWTGWGLIRGGAVWSSAQFEPIETYREGLRFAVMLGSVAPRLPQTVARPNKLALQLLEPSPMCCASSPRWHR